MSEERRQLEELAECVVLTLDWDEYPVLIAVAKQYLPLPLEHYGASVKVGDKLEVDGKAYLVVNVKDGKAWLADPQTRIGQRTVLLDSLPRDARSGDRPEGGTG